VTTIFEMVATIITTFRLKIWSLADRVLLSSWRAGLPQYAGCSSAFRTLCLGDGRNSQITVHIQWHFHGRQRQQRFDCGQVYGKGMWRHGLNDPVTSATFCCKDVPTCYPLEEWLTFQSLFYGGSCSHVPPSPLGVFTSLKQTRIYNQELSEQGVQRVIFCTSTHPLCDQYWNMHVQCGTLD